jgi:WhiB family transcriptional regulator, redox-sensing transcriptional regulator
MAAGLCRGHTRLFFPPLAERPQARARREAKARRICETCPVLEECRWYARVHREYGYWGAENEEERAAAGFSVPSPIGGRARRRPVDEPA